MGCFFFLVRSFEGKGGWVCGWVGGWVGDLLTSGSMRHCSFPSRKMPKMVPVEIAASMLEDPSRGSNTATYLVEVGGWVGGWVGYISTSF